MKQKITQEIKDALKPFFWTDEEGEKRVSLGNCRLDFKKDYYFEKFTKKGVKLYWINGTTKVLVIGKVEFNENYGDYAFYTEGWSYIEHFKLKGGKNEN
ncbi:MAG: hypothetical protein ACTSQY_09630 [Candidatus Odinarchaeia archaeon]